MLNDGGNPLNITGNIINYGTSGSINRVIQTNGITTIIGNIIGPIGGASYCIISTSTVNSVRIIGNIVCSNSYWPLNLLRFSISPSANMSIRFQDTNNANRFMYTSAQSTGQATESNVRLGIIYGPNNDYTGTCAVPPAAAVSLGVPVDNTVGTAELTASDMWNYDLVNVNNQPGTVGYTLKKIQPQKIQPQIIMNIGNIVT
jgi:hypothetical protein